MRRAGLLVACILAGVVGYYLPWYAHETAGFTMNAFDLAEWTSLHPAVRSSSPPLLTSFLLRMPQVMLAFALALAANKLTDVRWRWIVRGAAALLALRLIPPAEFFGSARGDPNYCQMALLTGIGLLGVAAAGVLIRLTERSRDVLLAAALASGILSGWIGLARAHVLLEHFEIHGRTGSGIIGLTLVSAVAVLIAGSPPRFRSRRSLSGPAADRA